MQKDILVQAAVLINIWSFMEQMKNHENYRYGVIGILASVAAVMLFGADNMVIPSMIMILVILLAGRKLEDRYGDAGSKR